MSGFDNRGGGRGGYSGGGGRGGYSSGGGRGGYDGGRGGGGYDGGRGGGGFDGGRGGGGYDGGRGGGGFDGGRGGGGRGYDGGRGGGGGGRGGGGGYDGGRGGGGYDGGRSGGGGYDGGRGGGGGRFDGGRGDGGRGRNRHMGEYGAIVQMCSSGSPGMNDRDILRVISPPPNERDRTDLVAAVSNRLPPQSAWRMASPIGRKIENGLKTNFYYVNPSEMTGVIYNYHVHIYKVDRSGTIDTKDVAATEDTRVTTSLLLGLRKKHPEWPASIGFAYDNRSNLYTSKRLILPSKNDKNENFLSEVIGITSNEDGESMKKRYSVCLTEIAELFPPIDPAAWMDLDLTLIRAFDTTLFSFARWQQVIDNPSHFLVGSKIYFSNSTNYRLANSYSAKKGYYASLKSCMAGTCLVVDMSVNCFLASGDMPELMFKAAGFRDFDEFYRECLRGLRPDTIAKISKVVKNSKVKINHLGHWRKTKDLGPRSDDPYSAFNLDGKMVTVAQYFEIQGRKQPAIYGPFLTKGKLRYPALPTINVGSNAKPVLIPPEMISVPGGQSRSGAVDADMTSQLIRYASVRPAERFDFINNGDSTDCSGIVKVLRVDDIAKAFGVSNTDASPMSVPCVILPQAKLRYGGDKIVDPGLTGTWNIDRPQMKFAKTPPGANREGAYTYGIMIVGEGPPPGPWKDKVNDFIAGMEQDGVCTGLKLFRGGDLIPTNDRSENLTNCFEKLKSGGARIVLVLMATDSYGRVKLVSDKMGLPTQCVKWKNVDRPPRGFHVNLLIKMNTKLGGTNHTLVQRAPSNPGVSVYQDPPNSLSWLFDKPCMLVGIDVSHAEPGTERDSMAAVVASMDSRASQYVAHLSAQNCRVEMVHALRDAMVSLLNQFKSRNGGKVPAHIIIYRDGVSDGQFDQVLDQELPAVKDALELLGYPSGSVKIAIIICQKGHHTRVFFEETLSDGTTQIINPCPGLLVDATAGGRSIASSTINEFYLNSHAAIQGTAKPCKYALIFDEIGFKISELELLTYWTTYLYARCNKSVSYATPAYYAHWASKRAKDLYAAGGCGQDLLDISAVWAANEKSTMFFI